jgi:hypothetical protein
MKTPEDEAFDEIERRQGGFKAKQDMAMHKTQDQNICRHYKQWQHCHICDLESQVAELAGIKAILDEYGLQAIDFVADFKEALAQPAQEPQYEFLIDDLTDWKQYVEVDNAPYGLREHVTKVLLAHGIKEKNNG